MLESGQGVAFDLNDAPGGAAPPSRLLLANIPCALEPWTILPEAGWASSLHVRNSAEAFVAARVADCAWRQERLARYEQSIWSACVESKLKKTEGSLQLSITRDALAGLQVA